MVPESRAGGRPEVFDDDLLLSDLAMKSRVAELSAVFGGAVRGPRVGSVGDSDFLARRQRQEARRAAVGQLQAAVVEADGKTPEADFGHVPAWGHPDRLVERRVDGRAGLDREGLVV